MYLTGLSREEMMFDKEKLLSVFDETVKMGKDPVRTKAGRLSCASEPATPGSPPQEEGGAKRP